MFYSLISNMKNVTFSTSLIIGALMLVGAGCNSTTTTDNKPAAQNPSTTTPGANDIPAEGDFVLTAELTGPKAVKVTWTRPALMDKNSVIRLMHSRVDNPSFPVPADSVAPYWYQPGAARTELDWSNIPVGTRYFRACEFKDDACVRHSNTVKLEVK
jgi:hypothetical protein